MGEAKRRRAAEAAREPLLRAADQVGHALRRLANAASGALGADCYVHAALGRELLADLGFSARLVVGEVAWRVGAGSGDVISHTLREQAYAPAGLSPEQMATAYHAWLVVDQDIIDFTTYQLERKARALDAADGGHTTVSWRPDVLVLPVHRVMDYRQVAQALKPGVAFYQEHPELQEMVASQDEVDPEDLTAARLLLANPEMQVFGPNDR